MFYFLSVFVFITNNILLYTLGWWSPNYDIIKPTNVVNVGFTGESI